MASPNEPAVQQWPVTVRRSIELLGIFLLGVLIYLGNSIIAPLLMAFFIAIVLLPLYRFFRNRKIPEVLAIVLCLLVFLALIVLVGWFLSSQISRLLSDFPQLKQNVTAHLNNLSAWINQKTNFSTERQLQLINEQSNKLLNYAGGLMSGAAASVTSIFIFAGLLPIYIFLMFFIKTCSCVLCSCGFRRPNTRTWRA
jgi:predicted PurR-regulated permease PerM